ncbi:MAG: O-antigen ligase family protein, partial [Actinomycetota bacterium]|nr:O-antigen ligase family protein [Actinomycetota bacterium]
AYVLLAFGDLTAALAVFAFLGFFELAAIGGAALGALKLAGLLLALSWFGMLTTRESAQRTFATAHPFVFGALVLFLAWAALSLIWAENTSQATTDLSRFALNAVLFLIIYSAVRKPSDAFVVAGAFVLGAAGAAIYGLLTPTAKFDERLTSAVLDPNELGATLVAGAALAGGIAAPRGTSPAVRLGAFAALVFCVVAALLTASRGSLIALAVAIVAGLVLAGRWRPRFALLAIVAVVGAFLYYAAAAPPETRERIEETTRGSERVQEGRTTIWQVGWRAFEANPVNGVGVGNFRTASRHYLLQPGSLARSDTVVDEPSVAHNTYLEVLAELGIVGIVLFGSVVFFSLGSSIKASRAFRAIGDHRMEALAIGLSVALIGTLAADFFISEQFRKQLWLLLGLGPALLSIARTSGAWPAPD